MLPVVKTYTPEVITADKNLVRVTDRKFYQQMGTEAYLEVQEGQSLESLVMAALRLFNPQKNYSDFSLRVAMRYCSVYVDGQKYPNCKDWKDIFPTRDSHIHIYEQVKGGSSGGGKSIIPLIGMIVLSVVAPWAGGLIAGALGFSATGIVAGVIGTAIMVGGSLLINMLFPQAQPSLNANTASSTETSRSYSLTGQQNNANPDGTVPVILGKHKCTPPLGSRSWTSWEGDTQYFHMLVVWGQAGVNVSNIKIGDTPLENFDNVEHTLHPASNGSELKIFGHTYREESIGAAVDEVGVWVERSLGELNEILIDITFNTLFISKSEGEKATGSAKTYFTAQYAVEGTENWVTFFDGIFNGEYQSFKAFPIGVKNLPLKDYKVRVKRAKESTTAAKYVLEFHDDATWATARAITYRPAFETQVDWCVSELRIQAHEQMTGYVDQLNAYVAVECEDWDEATGQWIVRETSNPASLARYALLSQHMLILPFGKGKIDDVAFQYAHNYHKLKGYSFNYICDSQISLWERLTQILSVGRSAINFIDGKWSVIVDNSDKIPTQLFTPHNSWGIDIQRVFPKLPHALRATFIDASDDYKEKSQMIYADGYNRYGTDGKKKAVDIIEWDFPGETSWEHVYKAGRRFLASTLHRPFAVSTNVDLEYLACKRGDLVGWSHIVMHNSFGSGHITTLIYEIDGELQYFVEGDDLPIEENAEDLLPGQVGTPLIPVGIRLNDTIGFTSLAPTRYGMAIRRVLDEVEIGKYEIIPDYGQESIDIFFMHPLTQGNSPSIGDLCAVGFVGDEYEEYLVGDITPSDDFTASLSFVPWAIEAIEAAESGEVPPFEPIVIQNTLPSNTSIKTPSIQQIQSNEGVMLASYGSFIIRMAVFCALPIGQDMNGLIFMATAKDVTIYEDEDELSGITLTATAQSGSNIVYFDNVQEGSTYEVTLRLVNPQSGASSASTAMRTHTVVGRTTPPYDVESFTATVQSPEGIKFTWSAVDVPDLDAYVISGDIDAVVKGTSYLSVDIAKKTGKLSFGIQARDVVGLLSRNIKTASVTITPPAMPNATTRLKTDGIFLEWQDCTVTWPIREYVVWDAYTSKQHRFNAEQLEISPRPFGDYRFNLRAVDIYNNESERAEITVTIAGIAAPVPSLAISGEVLRLSWKAVASPFPIDVYEIATSNGVLLQATKSTYYDVPPTAGGVSGVVSLQVRAKDTAGNYSAYTSFSAQIDAPQAPTVTVSVHEDKRQVVVSWDKPTSEAPISAYEVSAQYAVGGLLQEKEFGTFDVNTVFLEALSANVDSQEYTLHVRAVNYMGMVGAMGEASLQIQKLSAPQALTKSVTDNNVFLVWQDPASGSFAVKEYRVLRQEGSETQRAELFEEIGRIDSLFFGRFESKAGEYSYKIIPIDWAGVEGASATVLAFVDQPPDYTVYYDVDSTFNGAKTNFELDGKGGMIGAVVVGETWQENIDRIGQGDGLTWQQKHDLGHEYYLSPHLASGQYVEVVNINTFIAAGRIQVTCLYETLAGTADVSCKIETSDDGVVWTLSADGAWETYATGFQYVRYTITVSNAMIRITELNYKVDIKLRKDNGTVFYDAALGTSGVWVPFKTAFIDVQGAPICTVPSSTFDNPLTAYTIFEDVPNPQGFYVFVLNKNGTPTSADVTWLANGV